MDSEDFISARIEIEQIPVYTSYQITFKELSRKLAIDVNTAKQVLFDYTLKHKVPQTNIVYYLERHSEDGIKIQLAQGTDYQYLIQDCEKYIIHIHSIYPFEFKNADAIVSSYSQVVVSDTLETVQDCRTIQNSTILWSNTKTRRPVAAVSQPPKKSMSGPPQDTPKSPLAKKSHSTSQVSKKSKSASTMFASKSTGEKKPLKITKIDAKAKPKQESIENEETKKEAVVAETKDPVAVVKVPEPVVKQSASQANQIKQLFEDDEQNAPEPVPEPESNPTTEIRRVRKKRKVVTSKTFMEGKYMTTRDVEEWESYSEDEVVPVVPKSTKPNPKAIKVDPSVKGKGKNQQRTILTFFQKK